MCMANLHRYSLYWTVGMLLLGGSIVAANDLTAAGNPLVYEVKPSQADPAITRFDDPGYIVFNRESTSQQELVVFLPGTKGKPLGGAQLYGVIAAMGCGVDCRQARRYIEIFKSA